MSYKSVVIPSNKVVVSHQTGLGVSAYDLEELYSPDTAYWKAKVLDIGSPKYPPSRSPYWFDKSRYQNHGTIYSATWRQQPSGRWAMAFDGVDDYVNLGNPASLDLTGSFTIEMWIKFNVWTGSFTYYQKDASSTAGIHFLGGGTTALIIRTSQSGAMQQSYESGFTPEANRWYHIAATRNGTSARVYRDSVDVTIMLGSHLDPASTSVNSHIGAKSPTPSEYLNGLIGEVRIYNRALIALEIQRNYLATRFRYR